MKIVQLEAQNVKKLKAIEIRPDGNVIVIGGKNGAGKSSVIDSIAYALGGKSAIPSKPVRDGENKATVICELDDLIVKRTMTATGGGTLTVENKEGASYKSPQAMLDALVGRLSFDPLEFSRMDSRKQVEILKGLVGLDFSELNAKRQQLYEERTRVNTDGKRLRTQFDGLLEYPDVPDKEVSVSNLMTELQRREEINRANEIERDRLEKLEYEVADCEAGIKTLDAQIKELQEARKVKILEFQETSKNLKNKKKEVETLKDANVTDIRDQIANAEDINRQVRSNHSRKELSESLKEKRKESETLTKQIQDIDDLKAKQLSEAKFPVPGLSFSDSEILYNDILFNQASSAEQLRVSVAMGLAMNPKLKVLLIRDGSLLDDENLKLIAEMAEQADGQVWIERVGEGKEVSVIIEDGSIVSREI